MSKQIFKYVFPRDLFYSLLDKICEPSETEYIIDINSYKRMKFHNYHTEFLGSLVTCYHWSKRFYIERDFTYSSFITIIRQLCRLYNLTIVSSIQYSESTYSLKYTIQKRAALENQPENV